MIFKFLLFIFLGYEIHKLFQFNTLFKLHCVLTDYGKKLVNRTDAPQVHSSLNKISSLNLAYYIIIFVGVFTLNSYFFVALLLLANIQTLIFKAIKNKKIRKISYLLDIIVSILLLLLILINLYTYNVSSLDFIHKFFKF